MRRRSAVVALWTTAVLAAGGGALAFATGSASAATGYGVAPYVDLSANSSGMLDSAITQAGLKAYTAAFIIGSGCTPIWGDTLPDSDTLRSHLYNLRRVIDKPFDRPLLHTIHSAGYRLADLDSEVAASQTA